MIPCPECKKEISGTAKNCPNCGWHRSAAPLVAIWFIVAIIAILAGVCVWQLNQADEATRKLNRTLSHR